MSNVSQLILAGTAKNRAKEKWRAVYTYLSGDVAEREVRDAPLLVSHVERFGERLRERTA